MQRSFSSADAAVDQRARHTQLLSANQAAWAAMLQHPFLRMVADGSIPDEQFRTWIAQDYLFVQEFVPFLAVLLAKAPAMLRPPLIDALATIKHELELFERQAAAHQILLADVQPTSSCRDYVQFFLSTAYAGPFIDGFTVLYGIEKAYLDAWMTVKQQQQTRSPWQDFIDNWANESFQQYVDWLGTTLDQLTAGQPTTELDRLARLFSVTVQYEQRFWQMAFGETER